MSHDPWTRADVELDEAKDESIYLAREGADPTPFERTARHDEIVRLVRAGRINEARALAGARRAA